MRRSPTGRSLLIGPCSVCFCDMGLPLWRTQAYSVDDATLTSCARAWALGPSGAQIR